ncbi:MAG: YceI family protein, partial [Candidatus Omnitrophica bacterium]|nr:YceI family protein [Candidatus Omnitrophota bacterium]
HMMISKTTGSFMDYDGEIAFSADDLVNSRFDLTIKVASINTHNEMRDGHLKGAEFFEAEKYPTIVFKTKKIVSLGNDKYALTGDLTMKDVTKEMEIPVSILGPIVFPEGKGTGVGISSQFQINRQDFHVNFNKKLDNGGLMVGDVVDVTVNLEAHAK